MSPSFLKDNFAMQSVRKVSTGKAADNIMGVALHMSNFFLLLTTEFSLCL